MMKDGKGTDKVHRGLRNQERLWHAFGAQIKILYVALAQNIGAENILVYKTIFY